MWLWSKGLGRLILPMQLRDAELNCPGDTVKLAGWVIAPKVHWDYTLAMRQEDLLDFMRVLADPHVAAYLAREGGLRCLAILLKRAPRFALAFLAAELRKFGGKQQQVEESSDAVLVQGAGTPVSAQRGLGEREYSTDHR